MTAGWTWSYDRYEPERERLVEALCTLGNGRFATRGSAPECSAGPTHYPGTYLAGCYDRLTSVVGGERVENEDLVNLPNWTLLRYRCRPDDGPPGDWLTPDSEDLRHYDVNLDLRAGVLTRRLLFEDAHGRGLRASHIRVVHMGAPGSRPSAPCSAPTAGAAPSRSGPSSTAPSPRPGSSATGTSTDVISRTTGPDSSPTASPGSPAALPLRA